MKSLMRLWALLLIAFYGAGLALPAVALAQTAPRPTCTLSINPSVIQPGGSATITWRSTNATAGAITNVGNVSANGNKQILPPPGQVVTYFGSFTGPGGTANCTASVQVVYGTATAGSPGDLPATNPVNSGGTTQNNSDLTGATAPITPVTSSPLPPITSNTPQPALVQCGVGSGADATNCQACHLAQLIQNIINFLIGVSIPIAAGLFAWAGILYFSSGASPGNIEKAKGIFSNALIGFLIAITGWLVVNTLLHVLLNQAQFPNSSWFTVNCSAPNTRPIDKKINDVLNSVLPGVNTSAPTIDTSGTGVGVGVNTPGTSFDASTGCRAGGALQSDGTCLDAFGGTYPALDVSNGANSLITTAAADYAGTATNAGPNCAGGTGGQCACAWAVNNVLQAAGIAPIDGTQVQTMENALRDGGRGIPVDISQAQPGDIVIQGDDKHVGIVKSVDNGNITVISNSSTKTSFTYVSDVNFSTAYPNGSPSRIYRVNK